MLLSPQTPVTPPHYETLNYTISTCGVAYLTLNRPHRSNAINATMFTELPLAVQYLDECPDVNVILLQAAGNNFCAGIDLDSLTALTDGPHTCEGRRRELFRRQIKVMQDSISSLERCRKPVIAAIQGACIGGGIDIITACDLRYCTESAYFAVKEVDLAITADLGTLQRLPGLVGDGVARELALTGRDFNGVEAKALKLVSAAYPTLEALLMSADAIAKSIAAKSPLAVTGTKAILLHARDHSVSEGLDYVAIWNSAMLVSEDLKEVVEARKNRRIATFSKL